MIQRKYDGEMECGVGKEGSCISGGVIREILSEHRRDGLIPVGWQGSSQVRILGREDLKTRALRREWPWGVQGTRARATWPELCDGDQEA